jgi:transcriptional regulator with XRE-family HTH domain
MSDFHDRLRNLIQASEYDFKSLSLLIGQGERYISNLLASESDPGFSSVIRICSALGLTPNQIAGLTDQITISGDETDNRFVSIYAERVLTSITREARRKLVRRGAGPLLDDVLTWWHQQGGLLSNFDGLSEHVDLYHAPNPGAQLPEPYMIGRKSLATVSFGIETTDQLRHLFTTFDKTLSESVKLALVETTKGAPNLSIQEIDVMLPGHNFPMRFSYKRLLLPVHDITGTPYILNYSQALE